MKRVNEVFEVVVCGGGLAGFCAAIAAARHGAKTCIVQDRPMFGGNSSSEVRVTPHGTACFHAYARETGIISELLIEERATNHEQILENGWTNSVWDMVLYDMAMSTPNLTVHVNTAVLGVELAGGEAVLPEAGAGFGFLHRASAHQTPGRMKAVVCRVGNAEVELRIEGKVFIDCTGDGVVADLAGCEWRMGSEGRAEFNEPHAPAEPSKDTMGNSIHFKAKDMGRPVPFKAPEWAVKHENGDYFWKQGRHLGDIKGGYWWLEIGVPWDTIYQAEDIRHELTRHTLGVWDWIKNKDPKTMERAKNFGLDFIGQVPGKRESRRIMGQYFMTEHDVLEKTVFADEVAFGGWFVDLHTPGGLLAGSSEPNAAADYRLDTEYAAKSYCGPYGIPLRALIAKDVDNLMMAGRNVSVTHAALGTVRVMGTTALMGQAVGTGAAIALRRGMGLGGLVKEGIGELQQSLLRDGCFLPSVRNEDGKDLAREAKVTASSEAVLRGVGPRTKMVDNGMRWWVDEQHELDKADTLKQRRGQWIAVKAGAGSRVERVKVCVSNLSEAEQELEAWLLPVEHVWDYRMEPGAALAKGKLKVPVGRENWVAWEVNLRDVPTLSGSGGGGGEVRYLRLDLGANEEVVWHTSRAVEPGQVAAFQLSPTRMRRLHSGVSLSFLVEPGQEVYGAGNVTSGVTRPHGGTHLWRSDPALPLSQWVGLAWEKAVTMGVVELTFPGHLLREYHAYPVFYRDPQCPKDYVVEARVEGAWAEVARVEGNYQRHRRHTLERAVTTKELRVRVMATNGDASAAIYEVRCYA